MHPGVEQVNNGYVPLILHDDGSQESIRAVATHWDRLGFFSSRGLRPPRSDGSFDDLMDAFSFAAVVTAVARRKLEENTAVAGTGSVEIAWKEGIWLCRLPKHPTAFRERTPVGHQPVSGSRSRADVRQRPGGGR